MAARNILCRRLGVGSLLHFGVVRDCDGDGDGGSQSYVPQKLLSYTERIISQVLA